MENTISKYQKLNITNIKIIAVICMFIDHIHQMFAHVGAPIYLTMIGRIVFPLFLFAAAESFHYTRSKKAYLERLFISSFLMTIFTFTLQKILPNENIVLMNNAFGTFFVTCLYMMVWDLLKDGIKTKQKKKIIKAIIISLIPIIFTIPILIVTSLSFNPEISGTTIRLLATISLLFPNILTIEGGIALVILGVLFYIFRENRKYQILTLIIFSIIIYVIGNHIQSLMVFAVIPMLMYNGEKGKGMKNFFYIFYPLHIGVLYVISTLIFG